MSSLLEFTPKPPRGGLLLKKLFQFSLIMLIVLFVCTGKAGSQPIKIGLLIQDSNYTSAIRGAELAVRLANKNGGLNSRQFQLAVRSMEGPWGTGSKQAVNLIFEEKVWALLGSHDGRNAHLVEQAATKSTVVFVSAWSGDPTLSQAFVPWFFNCVPNDLQQAAALIEEIFYKRRISKVAVISENDYDSKQSLNNFLKEIKQQKKADPMLFLYENYSGDLNGMLDRINRAGIDCIILYCKPIVSYKIFKQIRQKEMDQSVFGSLYLLNEDELSFNKLQDYNNALLVPSGNWSDSKSSVFKEEYEKFCGRAPGVIAAYAFDGMNLLIEAIRNAGAPDREKIQKALKRIEYEGVTGIIKFDDKGNRSGIPVITKTRNGIPVPAGI